MLPLLKTNKASPFSVQQSTSNVHRSTRNREIRRRVQSIIVAIRVPRRVNNRLHVTRREELDPSIHTVCRWRSAGSVLRVFLPDLQVVPRPRLAGKGPAEIEGVYRVVALCDRGVADIGVGRDQGYTVRGGGAVGDVEPVCGGDAVRPAGCEEVGDAPGRAVGLAGDGGS